MDKNTRISMGISFCLLLGIIVPGTSITVTAVNHIIITEVHYDTYLPQDPEEFVRICNPTGNDVSLDGWRLSDIETNSAFPYGHNITSMNCIIVARMGDNFTEQAGEHPDFEMINTDINIPDMGGNLRLANGGDEVFLIDPDDWVVDAFVYGNSTYSGPGWVGDPVFLVDSVQFQRYYTNNYFLVRNRKRDESIEGQYKDTDSAADWDNNRMEDYVRYIGGSRFDYPRHFIHSGNITIFNSPDTAYQEVINFIDSADSSLYISLYDWNNLHIMDHLVNASNGGVLVKILLDGDSNDFAGVSDTNKYIAKQIEEAGGNVAWMIDDVSGTRNRYASMHAKYAIADTEDVLIQSGNWKYPSVPVDPSAGNREWNIIIWNNSNLANYLIGVFNDDYDIVHKDIAEYCTFADWCEPPINFTANRTVDTGNYTHPFTSKNMKVSNMPIEVILSPDTSMLLTKSIIGMLRSAGNGSEVYWNEFYAWRCWGIPRSDCTPAEAPNVYLEEAIDAARRGARVKILLDSTEYNIDDINKNQDTVTYVNNISSSEGLNLEARLVNSTITQYDKIHNKGMIVDDKVLISSININFHSTHLNRELGIIVTNQAVADYFKEVFFYDWGSMLTEEIQLFEGWNLISTPLEPENTSIEAVVGDLVGGIRVTAYNTTADEWYTYDSDSQENATLFEIVVGRGYWLYSEENQTLIITGTPMISSDIDLHSGWNLVGYNYLVPRDISDVISEGHESIVVLNYDAAGDRWGTYTFIPLGFLNTFTRMEPGSGYWIYRT